jgi:MFS family permease
VLFAFGELKTASLVMGFICCAGLFALSAPLQILLLQNAKGRDAGAAGGQMAFNLGSAIGAYFGGMMITLGFSWSYITLPAAILSFSAMTSLLIYGHLSARKRQANARAQPDLARRRPPPGADLKLCFYCLNLFTPLRLQLRLLMLRLARDILRKQRFQCNQPFKQIVRQCRGVSTGGDDSAWYVRPALSRSLSNTASASCHSLSMPSSISQKRLQLWLIN